MHCRRNRDRIRHRNRYRDRTCKSAMSRAKLRRGLFKLYEPMDRTKVAVEALEISIAFSLCAASNER